MADANAYPGRPMEMALQAAREAAARGEVPVGAVVLAADGKLLACAGNQTEAMHDASAHAEMIAMRMAASQTGNLRLIGCTLVASLEPCAMCAAAASHFRIARLLFGAYDPKGGAVEHGARLYDRPDCLHRPEWIGGIGETESAALLRAFFELRRG